MTPWWVSAVRAVAGLTQRPGGPSTQTGGQGSLLINIGSTGPQSFEMGVSQAFLLLFY